MSETSMIIAIIAMALVTALSRVLPFLLPRENRLIALMSREGPSVQVVGPALIVALAVFTLTEPMMDTVSIDTTLNYSVGALVTMTAYRLTRSVGLSVIAGILGFATIDWILST